MNHFLGIENVHYNDGTIPKYATVFTNSSLIKFWSGLKSGFRTSNSTRHQIVSWYFRAQAMTIVFLVLSAWH